MPLRSTNGAVITAGLFGRLSILEAPREKVLERIRQISKEFEDLRQVLQRPSGNVPSAEETLRQAMPLLLRELSSLVESIVLAESLIDFRGYNLEHLQQIFDEHQMRPRFGRIPVGWHYTQFWADEANDLYERTIEGVDAVPTETTDAACVDVEIVLQFPHDVGTFTPAAQATTGNALDYSKLEYKWDEIGPGTAGEELSDWNKLQAFVDRRLGQDWVAYRTAVDVASAWPETLSRDLGGLSTFGPQRDRLTWQFKLALYLELRASLDHGSTAVSNFASGQYHRLLVGSDNTSGHLRNVVSRSYSAALQAKLEEQGFAWLELSLPPILRLCLADSNTVGEIIKTAIRFRSHSWFKRLRKYLGRLAEAERGEQVVRHLTQLKTYIDDAHTSFSAMALANLGVSSAGSLSISIPAVGRKLLAWRNPVVYIHSQIQKSLVTRDSIADLARVFKLSRSEATKVVTAADVISHSAGRGSKERLKDSAR